MLRELGVDVASFSSISSHHQNTTIKQCIRQLTTDNRTLDEHLKAARSNLRFQDRRSADLEAQIVPPSRQ